MHVFVYNLFLLSLKLSSSNKLSSLWIVLQFPLSCSAPCLHLPPLWDVSVTITHGVHGPFAPKPVTLVPKHVQGNRYLTYFWCAKFIILICTFVLLQGCTLWWTLVQKQLFPAVSDTWDQSVQCWGLSHTLPADWVRTLVRVLTMCQKICE